MENPKANETAPDTWHTGHQGENLTSNSLRYRSANPVCEAPLTSLIDIQSVCSLLNDFSALVGITTALLDLQGNILQSAGWQPACTGFHRAVAGSCANCIESDLFLARHLREGEFVDYKCKNGLWDVVTPVFVGKQHLGNLYSGQFFYDDDVVDEGFFVAQAERFGYDKDAYLAAIRKVPRFSREYVRRIMVFMVGLASHLSRLSLTNLKLRESQGQMETLVNALPDPVWLKDTQGVYVSCNRAFERLLGAPAADIVGKTDFDFFPKEDAEFFRRNDQETIKAGRPFCNEERIADAESGEAKLVETVKAPLPAIAGKTAGVIGIARDITERKRAAAEILRLNDELEERIREHAVELADTRLLQGISSALIEHDCIEELYNKIMGAAVAIMHSDCASMQVLHSERGSAGKLRLLASRGFGPEAVRFWEWVDAESKSTCGVALRTGKRVVVAELEKCDFMAGSADLAMFLENGIHAVQSTPLLSRTGRLVGMISTHWCHPHQPSERDLRLMDILARQAADLIERKQAEAEIQALNAILEERVKRRTAELEAANRELESFTYAASHDMRAPLGRIHSFSTLLSRNYRDRLDGDGLVFLELIRQNANRLNNLVEDLLVHAQIGQQAWDERPTDVEATVRLILNERAEDIAQGAVEIRLDLSGPLVVRSNPTALCQILRNLVDNALKYSRQARPPIVEIGARLDDRTCLVWIRDNGIGIEPIYQERIFEIFRRLHTYDEYPGSGIGLALVKKAVERLNGRVRVESLPGQGATFLLELPA